MSLYEYDSPVIIFIEKTKLYENHFDEELEPYILQLQNLIL